jgi:hypothetical protein
VVKVKEKKHDKDRGTSIIKRAGTDVTKTEGTVLIKIEGTKMIKITVAYGRCFEKAPKESGNNWKNIQTVPP